ncbi:MAG TPA: DUF4097 family beta strand repeat-containing protein [Pyrinomonadaceae bacterium]|nr:DUF4097 family beta strand repeat-containing protein [Pyrinomonadaceae bacterium]
MRFKPSITALLLAILLLCGASAHAQQKPADKGKDKGVPAVEEADEAEVPEEAQDAEETEKPHGAQEAESASGAAVAATPDVNVTVSTTGGRISVRGTDRKEVRARVTGAPVKLKMRVVGAPESGPQTAASRVEVLISDKSKGDGEAAYDSCLADYDVELEVPTGATVYLKTQDGDITVQDVTEAHLETNDGRIEATRISKAVDAASLGGNVTLEDASGRANLTSLNGVVEVRGVRPLDGSDFLKVKTVSGDILLDEIGPARVEADTISGEMRLSGPLARGGTYDFTTTTGDVTIMMPADSSFKVNAKVSEHGEIDTEFPLQYRGSASPTGPPQPGRLLGTHGSGDASITLVSFSGTLKLRKQ